MSTGVRSMGASSSRDVPIVRSNAWLTESFLQHTNLNLLRQDAHSVIPTTGKQNARYESMNRFAPIITVNDLMKSDGDKVEVPIYHALVGDPSMCCEVVEGKGEDITYSLFDLQINQTRKLVNTGCTMDSVRLGKKAMQIAKPLLMDWQTRLDNERSLYHLAGARGHYNKGDIIMPLDTGMRGSKFSERMINCVMPPTACRHFYGGNAESVDGKEGQAIMANDTFNLKSLIKLASAIESSSRPIMPIKMDGVDAFWVLFVTSAQMATFKLSTDYQKLQQLQAQVTVRSAGCNHKLFKGDCFMYENILVRVYNPPVRFKANMPFKVANKSDACGGSTRTTMFTDDAFYIDRAILVGGQALAEAFGSVKTKDNKTLGKLNYAFSSRVWDHGDKEEIGIKAVSGLKKIQIEDRDGCLYDRGVAVLDTAVPAKDTVC